MLRNVFIPMFLLTCLLIAGCGGGSTLDRDLSKKGTDDAFLMLDAERVGCPAVVRCVASCPTIEVLSWSWGVSNGRIVEQNGDGSIVWISIDEPGVCTLSARGVDKDGKDCTTPRHKIRCAPGLNSPPVPLPDGPFDHATGEMSDNDGTPAYRYHDWRWTNGRSYDAEGDTFDTQFFMYASPDLDGDGDPDGDGEPEIMVSQAGDGSVRTADLDGDGLADVAMMPTRDGSFVVRVMFRTIKSKEDVYVWKMTASSNGVGKKEFKGHVTLLK